MYVWISCQKPMSYKVDYTVYCFLLVNSFILSLVMPTSLTKNMLMINSRGFELLAALVAKPSGKNLMI
jgi:hypothetical protein